MEENVSGMDYIVMATAADAQIRAFAATTRKTVETARRIHNTSPVVTAALGRLLTAGAMMGSMLKGERDILTLRVNGDGPMGGMIVTADSRARVKGYPFEPQVLIPANEKGKLDVARAVGSGMLSVVKDMGLKEPYVGQTVLKSGEIAEDLTYYFAASEQVPSSVGLGVLMEKNNTVRQAGGFILQLMPFSEERVGAGLERKLEEITSVTDILDAGNSPEQMLELILGDFGLKIQEQIPASWHCNCGKERVEKAIVSIGKKEIRDMIDDGEDIEVKCHFCNHAYRFTVGELEEIIKRSR